MSQLWMNSGHGSTEKLVVVNRHKHQENSQRLRSNYSSFYSDQFVRQLSQEEHAITPRKIPPQNIILRLMQRETYPAKQNVAHFYVARAFHQNIFPNFTVINVEKPPCFLRKFCPDGRYFVAFSSDQTSIEIYEYNGPAAAEGLLKTIHGEHTASIVDQESREIKNKIFEHFFKLKHVVNVAASGEPLNRECSLFTDDGKYVIVGSAAYVPDEIPTPFFDIYSNNESVSPNPRSPLEDYSLHLVDIQNGHLCDKRTFKTDKIFLSHNQGLYLYKDTLAVLSVQHQTIHIFQVTSEGKFVNVRMIGRFCHDDDDYIVSSAMLLDSTPRANCPPYREVVINALKHRILAFLYNKASKESETTMSKQPLRRFYQYFDQLCMLRMWKMQLLDENHLLIKYASEDVITLRINDPNSQPSFFIIYNMITTKVLAVYENTSEELLELFENFCDLFRNAALHSESQLTCSPSNNIHSRLLQQRFKQTIINARYGGHTEAVKRLLAQLPISSQSYSSSPYLDLSLFSYDDKWVSVLERPKNCGDHPIRFYARDSGLLKYKIYAGDQERITPSSARRLVAFTFHPFDPFAISVQRTNAEYVVNFHIRHIPSGTV